MREVVTPWQGAPEQGDVPEGQKRFRLYAPKSRSRCARLVKFASAAADSPEDYAAAFALAFCVCAGAGPNGVTPPSMPGNGRLMVWAERCLDWLYDRGWTENDEVAQFGGVAFGLLVERADGVLTHKAVTDAENFTEATTEQSTG